MVAPRQTVPTSIVQDALYTTEINFIHVDEVDHARVLSEVMTAAKVLTEQSGYIAVNVLGSRDGSRICTYIQWQNDASLLAARRAIQPHIDRLIASGRLRNDPQPRTYSIVYTDDRSQDGVSVITASLHEAIFINEITTLPEKQDRLLELVIANNQAQSLHTPGYRSANFHKSHDGERAVNYSLWDTEEHCIEAISNMADMDENLDETVEIANPDFRFYTVAYAAHV